MTALDKNLAAAFARVALANVTREYPRIVAHLALEAPGDLTPRTLHPAFYGSFDWHSAVHMHWLLARVLRTHPGLPEAPRIVQLFDEHLNEETIARELAYFCSPSGRTFERPYGWAWLLELRAELARLGQARWSAALAPLASLIVRRLARFVASAPYPIRAGTHGNTAFACILALDYAGVVGEEDLRQTIGGAARRWYGRDRDAPIAYEPSLDDFLSPALLEAVLMQQVLPGEEFARWFADFLPSGIEPLETPPVPSDRSDPRQSHLDGLSLSRAWCFRRLGDKYAEAAARHLAAALPHSTGGDYAGTHWLASFAALALGDSP